MANPLYPASSLSAATSLTIANSNIQHEVINGDDTTEITVDDGNIPSLRKAMKDNFYYKDPIDWNEGSSVVEFNQLVRFTDGTIWVAPTARVSVPILMGVTPIGDSLWAVAPFSDDASATSAAASASSATTSASEAATSASIANSSSGIILGTNMIATQNLVLGFHPLY